jgi:heptosyltransferase II
LTRVLVVAPSWVGDAVLAQPMFMRLHERIPDLRLDVLAPAWTLPVFRRMPEVSVAIPNPFGHGEFKLFARRQLGRQLGYRNYQRAIVLPNSFKSALVPWFAGIGSIAGYRGEKRGWILTDCRDLNKSLLPLMVERFAWLAQPASTPLGRPLPNPRLTVNGEARLQALKKFALDSATPVVAFCPGAEYGTAKRWPTRHFAALARALAQEGKQIWLFGSAKDKEITAEIQRASGDLCIDLAGATTIDEAIDLLSLAQHVVTNDSGLMHIACAVGVPVTALYGSSSPDFTPPLSALARTIWLKQELQLDCSPCFKRECPLGHFNCMNQLSPERVLADMRSSPTHDLRA